MLDAALFRDDFDATRDRLLTRGAGLESALAALAELDQARRRILPRVETLKHERNQAGEAIAKAKRAGEDASALLEANRAKAEIRAAFSGAMMKFWKSLALSTFFASLSTATLSMNKGKPSLG